MLEPIAQERTLRLKTITDWIDTHRQTLLKTIDKLLIVLGIIAVLSLVARIGFFLSPEQEKWASYLELTMLYLFAVQAFLKLVLSPSKVEHLKKHWLELSIFTVILLYLLFPFAVERVLTSLNPQLTPENLTGLYLVITQFFVILALLPATLRYSASVMTANIQPATILLASFLLLTVVGTGFLLLPKATAGEPIAVIDALFMATSAVCVTGLVTLDVATAFSHTGHWILLVLIQIGGLGIMTLTTFFAAAAGTSARLKEYIALRELIGEESLGKIRLILLQIGLYTTVVEAIGAVLIYHTLNLDEVQLPMSSAFFAGFHAISAFCNAGFALLPENLAAPMCKDNLLFLSVIMCLVVIGGLGFPALASLSGFVFAKLRREPNARLSIHAKLVFLTSAILIGLGTVGIYALEASHTMKEMSIGEGLFAACFHSIVARTAGFNTLDIAALATPTLFLIVALMWIGASPSSTGGGIKTTTAALAILNIVAIASGKTKIELFRRRIPDRVITRAFSTTLLSLLYIVMALFILLITEQEKNFKFEALLFEVVSAVSTVGLSTGITSELSNAGKLVIIVSMLVGRVGFLNVIIALMRQQSRASYDYAEETVLVS